MANSAWQEVRLAEICDSIDYGYTASASEIPTGPRFLRITDIVPGYIDWKSVPFCPVGQETTEKYRLHDGDIVIARTGASTGISAYIADPPDAIFASYLVRLKVSEQVNGRFVSYFLKSSDFWDYIRGVLGDKSAQPNASARTMTEVRLRLPSLDQQKVISSILGSLDDKIDLNRRMNETLEAMARAMFKSWFVDFDPVRAKAEGHPPAHMDAEIAALFPDAFDDDKMPMGWHWNCLGDIAENPKRTVKPDAVKEDTPYIGLEHMPRRSIALTVWEYAGKVTSTKSSFEHGEFLFGKLRPYFHKVGIAPVSGICSTDILVVKPKAPVWSGFAISCIATSEFVSYTDQTSTGTKMPRTNWKDMSCYEIALPDQRVAEAFNKITEPMFDRIVANIHENRALADLRDVVLPKLMSGEIRVRDAEK